MCLGKLGHMLLEKRIDNRPQAFTRNLNESHRPMAWAVLLVVFALTTAGCSTFNRDWRRAAAVAPPAGDITGPWKGSWVSQVNGHHGALRSLVARIDDTNYRSRYRATYWRWFRFRYAVDVRVVRDSDGVFKFEGEADLGWLAGGLYRYTGHATPTNFVSTYQSRHDHGVFEMTRPGR